METGNRTVTLLNNLHLFDMRSVLSFCSRGLLEAKAMKKWNGSCSHLTKALVFTISTLHACQLVDLSDLVVGSSILTLQTRTGSSQHSQARARSQ